MKIKNENKKKKKKINVHITNAVAQLVECRTHDPEVGGSIPPSVIFYFI
jgi:hypothetical protein